MMYQKTEINQEQLKQTLQERNPQKYDEIRLIFKNGYAIELYELNSKWYDGKLYSLDGEYHKDIERDGGIFEIFCDSLYYGLDEDYYGYTYDDIRKVICFYYHDQTKTDYTGKKLEEKANKKGVTEYFISNKKALKEANFGGTQITGIGAKKIKIQGEFYSYKYVYDVLTGNKQDYTIEKILKFLTN